MDQFIDWVYSQLVGFFGNFFAEMGNMGVELFEMSWVQSIVLFFSYLAWTLYVVGLVVAVFEVGIEYQTGRASIKDAAISAVKGFMAVGCFTLVPVELYKLSVTLQASLTSGITGYGESFDALSTDIINSLQGVDIGDAASSGVFGGIGSITSPIMVIFIIIMMGYAVIKCFFSNLKRGGILLIQIPADSRGTGPVVEPDGRLLSPTEWTELGGNKDRPAAGAGGRRAGDSAVGNAAR